MDAQVLNFKRYDSGAMVGFFDLAVSGIVVTGCKAFRKRADDGAEKLWFAWPSEKSQDKAGNDQWRDIVTAAEPVMRHLQGLVRGQLRALVADGGVAHQAQHRRPSPKGEDLGQYRTGGAQDDIPF